MNESDTAFDNPPDQALSTALRTALTPGDTGEFVGRVLALADRTRGWRLLAAWARAGIAAAAVAALLAGAVVERMVALDRSDDAIATLGETSGIPTETALLAAEGMPDPSVLLTGTFEP
jgi:hypothetical protein